MNYLDLINDCLVELNYKQVVAFSELTKNEHKKLKNILNVLNAEICGLDKWHFLLRRSEFNLPKNKGELENEIDGRISALIIDGEKYEYFEDFEKFFTNSQPSNTYSVFNNKILLPLFDEDKVIEVLYYTKSYAISEDGQEKYLMETDTDLTVIPAPFAEPLLVYGACMRLKGNPQQIRFNYWYSMYKEALANLRSRISVNVDAAPSVKLFRY